MYDFLSRRTEPLLLTIITWGLMFRKLTRLPLHTVDKVNDTNKAN